MTAKIIRFPLERVKYPDQEIQRAWEEVNRFVPVADCGDVPDLGYPFHHPLKAAELKNIQAQLADSWNTLCSAPINPPK